MAIDAATVEGLLSRRRAARFKTLALAAAAIALSLGAAAWITDSGQALLESITPFASAALPPNTDRISFEDRFASTSPSRGVALQPALQSLDRPALAAVEMKIQTARDLLAGRLTSGNWRAGLFEDSRVETKVVEAKVDETRPTTTTSAIPLPRSRPAAADLEMRPAPGSGAALALAPDTAPRPDDRTLMQKLSDLLPGRVTLASLTPDGGLFRSKGPDLAALGYDDFTAVYDITAHAVYLPNRTILEAHSGMGSLRDDPEHVSVPNFGATPPAIYDLKPREKMFHGVQALRMIPLEGSDIAGRSGLLTHSFMLGAKGDSNGCVSIKDYDRFLKAYTDGQVNRLVVVPSLSAGTMTAQRSTSPS